MEITLRELKDLKSRKFPIEICFKPIGIIHTPFNELKGIPIQPSMSESEGTIEIFSEFEEGLKDLDGFSHVICLYYFDMVQLPVPLQSKPFLVNEIKGVFAIRTPFRPNPIGISVLKIKEIKKSFIFVYQVDILDKTPLIDIKPYIPQFDSPKASKIGWLKKSMKRKVS